MDQIHIVFPFSGSGLIGAPQQTHLDEIIEAMNDQFDWNPEDLASLYLPGNVEFISLDKSLCGKSWLIVFFRVCHALYIAELFCTVWQKAMLFC